MSKSDEIVEKLHDIETKQAVEAAVKANNWAWIKKTIGICVSATSALIYFFVWLGSAIYDKYEFIQIGVKAAYAAMRGSND